MPLQDIIGERDNHDNSCRGCAQREPGQPLHECCEEGCREVTAPYLIHKENYMTKWKNARRAKEKFRHTEEPGPVFEVQNIAVEEGIEPCVE